MITINDARSTTYKLFLDKWSDIGRDDMDILMDAEYDENLLKQGTNDFAVVYFQNKYSKRRGMNGPLVRYDAMIMVYLHMKDGKGMEQMDTLANGIKDAYRIRVKDGIRYVNTSISEMDKKDKWNRMMVYSDIYWINKEI